VTMSFGAGRSGKAMLLMKDEMETPDLSSLDGLNISRESALMVLQTLTKASLFSTIATVEDCMAAVEYGEDQGAAISFMADSGRTELRRVSECRAVLPFQHPKQCEVFQPGDSKSSS